MATNLKKKNMKDGDKKSIKRSDDLSVTEEKREHNILETDIELEGNEESAFVQETPIPDILSEPVYEEPVLTLLIVER